MIGAACTYLKYEIDSSVYYLKDRCHPELSCVSLKVFLNQKKKKEKEN